MPEYRGADVVQRCADNEKANAEWGVIDYYHARKIFGLMIQLIWVCCADKCVGIALCVSKINFN